MRLKPGDLAPEIKAQDIYGETINLSDLKGRKVFLSFFRTASCPFCNLRVREIINAQQQFEAENIVVIGFFNATKEEILQYAGNEKNFMKLMADPESNFYRKFKIEASHLGLFKVMLRVGAMFQTMKLGLFNMKSIGSTPILPADFFIDDEGIIQEAYYGRDFGDHMPLKHVLKD